jgi:hypothetical protein
VRTAVTGISLIRMRPEVQVLPGPPPAMTRTNAGRRVRSSARRQCAGSRTPYLVTVSSHGCVALRLRTGPLECHPAARTAPSGPPTTCRVGLASLTLAGSSSPSDRERHGGRALAVAPSGRRPHPDRARQAQPPGSTVDARCGSGWAVPACVVGWSEPGNQASAVTPHERPEDPPARGVHHPARLGVRQGP